MQLFKKGWDMNDYVNAGFLRKNYKVNICYMNATFLIFS